MEEYKVGIVVSSDRCYNQERIDESGRVLKEALLARGYNVLDVVIVPDDKEMISKAMLKLCDEERVSLLLTSGGTGFSPRDITPEATLSIIDRLAPGIPEAIRAKSLEITPNAMLSRGIAGIRGKTLIINLPGSPKGAMEGLDVVINQIPHALGLLNGKKMDK